MFASMLGEKESIKNLIIAKADVNLKTKEGETPLQRAVKLDKNGSDRKEIISMLKKAGAQ